MWKSSVKAAVMRVGEQSETTHDHSLETAQGSPSPNKIPVVILSKQALN